MPDVPVLPLPRKPLPRKPPPGAKVTVTGPPPQQNPVCTT
jgi:hypothetical protein